MDEENVSTLQRIVSLREPAAAPFLFAADIFITCVKLLYLSGNNPREVGNLIFNGSRYSRAQFAHAALTEIFR